MKRHFPQYLAMLISVFIALLSSGCWQKENHFYQGSITSNQVSGVWLLTKESQQKLIKIARFKIYTNRTDHVLVLNANGTCIYRAMNSYSGHFSAQSEEAQYCNFLGETSGTSTHRDFDAQNHTWYVWDLLSTNLLTGPFAQRPERANGSVMKNKWTYWALSEKQRFFDDGYKGRTRLGFRRVDIISGTSEAVWFFGERHGRLFLWQWIRAPFLNEVIEFEKSDISSVKNLAEEERKGVGLQGP